MSINLGIHGITGRMGSKTFEQAKKDAGIAAIYGFSKSYKPSDEFVFVSSHSALLEISDVVIDFSSNEGLAELLKNSFDNKTPLVIGTTGLSAEVEELIKQASKKKPIVYSANFSLGVAACLQAAEILSDILKNQFTIHIKETHHIHKKDAPSGTAIALARAAGATNPIESIREGEVIGRHQIFFSNSNETIELCHEAHSREAFAFGAVFAAKALVLKQPGLYSLKDLFDIKSLPKTLA